jgi:hypothetical protein
MLNQIISYSARSDIGGLYNWHENKTEPNETMISISGQECVPEFTDFQNSVVMLQKMKHYGAVQARMLCNLTH